MTDTRTQLPSRPPPAPTGGSAVYRRLARVFGAFLIGSVVAPAVAVSAVAVAFGGVAVGAGIFAVSLATGALLLGAVHRATQVEARRPAFVSSLGWGVGVLLASVLLVAGCAAAWQGGGREFGGSAALWWSLSGAGVALVAAFCTRGAALAATAISVLAAVGAVTVLGVPDDVRSAVGAEAPVSSGLSRSLIHVTSPVGYDDGQITTDSPGSTIIYQPVDGPPVGEGPDLLILLTSQEPAPAECGRPQNLPFDDLGTAGCEELAPGVFYRSTAGYHEVVVVGPTVVITASGSMNVSKDELMSAARSARQATDDDVGRLYKGWVLDP